MFTIYVYVLDTLADWELGYVISELNSGRFFKKGEQHVSLKTVSYSKETINTMGGMTVVPHCLIDDIVVSETSVLLLPGAETWNDPKHGAIIEKANEFINLCHRLNPESKEYRKFLWMTKLPLALRHITLLVYYKYSKWLFILKSRPCLKRVLIKIGLKQWRFLYTRQPVNRHHT